jgi:dTDP-glucose pyrophosphorylase
MKAMILAAGRATRGRPLTETLPKPVMEMLADPLRSHRFIEDQRPVVAHRPGMAATMPVE